MNPRLDAIKQLLDDGVYVIDERAIAEALLSQTTALRMLADAVSRRDARQASPASSEDLDGSSSSSGSSEPQVRSFRPHRGARSFRLIRPHRQRSHGQQVTFASAG